MQHNIPQQIINHFNHHSQLAYSSLPGCSISLLTADLSHAAKRPLIIVANNAQQRSELYQALELFMENMQHVYEFPDLETLPYDPLSPNEDLVAERIKLLYNLPNLAQGIVLITLPTLLQRTAPCDYILGSNLHLKINDSLNLSSFSESLSNYGYHQVNKVTTHGEFAIRGSIIDLFPAGSNTPFRIELFDDEIEKILTFNPEDQLTTANVNEIKLLAAHEYPLTTEGVNTFKENFRNQFSGNALKYDLYQDVSRKISPAGIEYYLPLFFTHTNNIFDYLPQDSIVISIDNLQQNILDELAKVKQRYQLFEHDINRPILPPEQLYLTNDEVFACLQKFKHLKLYTEAKEKNALPFCANRNFATDHKSKLTLQEYIDDNTQQRYLLCTSSLGRAHNFQENANFQLVNSWQEFSQQDIKFAVIAKPIALGFCCSSTNTTIIAEHELFKEREYQKRPRKVKHYNSDEVFNNLNELSVGDKIVHIEHGVAQYLGLKNIQHDNQESEFLTLEYANKSILYVPIYSLHLISRYSGPSNDAIPLDNLGTNKWQKTKQQALNKIRNVATKLLTLYASRKLAQGHAYPTPSQEYHKFAAKFPYQLTEDQENAIEQVKQDLAAQNPMDRLICGDVGFGKTEIALRAACIVVFNHAQVALIAPTTLLCEQHYETFVNRFLDLPVKVALLSRFTPKKEQDKILEGMSDGTIDIVIGTHKLLQPNIKFNNLGLLIIDEEHRFGVKHKEKLKSLRNNVEILTLTATPIPRTLNFALLGIRDISIIATAPQKRLAIKTFIYERSDLIIQEAITRELSRGGQIYFVHNDIATMELTAQHLQKLAPQAKIAIAHGQMSGNILSKIMHEFYQGRYHILVCTTIIENGLDVANANTIFIDRADRFGLSQIHQLRGRVGRSHHQAYAYLFTPARKLLAKDAKHRLDALTKIEDLGAGFMLANHDLEIRGGGEILGIEQSGHMHAIGYSLYMDYLNNAIKTLQRGEPLLLDEDLDSPISINVNLSCLIPATYISDAKERLILYKRLATCESHAAIEGFQCELIDRFGGAPQEVLNLIAISKLKVTALALNVIKIDFGKSSVTIVFGAKPKINHAKLLQLIQQKPLEFKLINNNTLQIAVQEQAMHARIKFIETTLQSLT